VCPAAQGGWIGSTRWILAVRCGLVGRVAGGEALTGQLAATQCERCGGYQPPRQNSKGLSARATNSTAHPNLSMPVVVGETKSPSVTHNGVIPAQRAAPWQEVQRDYPGSMLSFVSGSEIKRITAGVKAPPRPSLPSFDLLAGPSPSRLSQIQTKKEYSFRPSVANHLSQLWPV
jgi:hypothetical protein